MYECLVHKTKIIKMSVEPQKTKNSKLNCRQSHCSGFEKYKTFRNDLKTQFIKLNQIRRNNIQEGCGHSQMTNNNFSRRNSVSTLASSASVDNLTPTATTSKNSALINKCSNRCVQSQQSLSMSLLKNLDDCNVKTKKERNNFEFTEQRCNYERMAQQKLQRQQLLRPWSLEQVISCDVSNSRIPTCSVDQNQNQHDSKTIFTEYVALKEFRMQNSKDCFSDRHSRLLQLQAKIPSLNHSVLIAKNAFTTTVFSKTQPYELNC